MTDREMTFGETAVGLDLNPSNSDAVSDCKQGFAHLIDAMNNLRNGSTGERARYAAVAITELQTAQMWAVKAITFKY